MSAVESWMTAPVVIGAVGGSGTRVVARVVRAAGVFMGTELNDSEDALPFAPFHDRWISRFVSAKGKMPDDVQREMTGQFLACVERHRRRIPDQRAAWGWKGPRTIYLLPFIHQLHPAMKFIHVVRDGRDMAFSSNMNQVRKHGAAVLGDGSAGFPEPARAAALWRTVNLTTADYGEARLGPRYLRVKFETLCQDPKETIGHIQAFVGRPEPANLQALIEEIKAPASIGRWRSQDAMLVNAVLEQAAPALERLGYC